jgi:hypothetical protein
MEVPFGAVPSFLQGHRSATGRDLQGVTECRMLHARELLFVVCP